MCVSHGSSHHVGCDEDLETASLLVHKSSSVSNVVSQPYVHHSGGISGGGHSRRGEGGLDWISNGEEFTLMEDKSSELDSSRWEERFILTVSANNAGNTF